MFDETLDQQPLDSEDRFDAAHRWGVEEEDFDGTDVAARTRTERGYSDNMDVDDAFNEPNVNDQASEPGTHDLQLADGAEGEPYADDYFNNDDYFNEAGGDEGDLDDTDDEARAHELQGEDGQNPDDAEREPDANNTGSNEGDLDDTDDEARAHELQEEDRRNPDDAERESDADNVGSNGGDLDNTDDEARAHELQGEDGQNPDDAERESDADDYIDEPNLPDQNFDDMSDASDGDDATNRRAQMDNWDEHLEDPDWNLDDDSDELSQHSGSEFGEPDMVAARGREVTGVNRHGTGAVGKLGREQAVNDQARGAVDQLGDAGNEHPNGHPPNEDENVHEPPPVLSGLRGANLEGPLYRRYHNKLTGMSQ